MNHVLLDRNKKNVGIDMSNRIQTKFGWKMGIKHHLLQPDD